MPSTGSTRRGGASPRSRGSGRTQHAGSEYATWLTAAELKEMNDDVVAVLRRHLERLHDPSLRPPGSRLCEFVAWGVPMYLPGVEPTPEETDR